MRATLCMGVLVAALGCTHSSRVEEHFGEAQGALVGRMVENPEAETAPPAAVEGLDPDTTEAVAGKYLETQRESPEPASMPSIIQIDAGGSR